MPKVIVPDNLKAAVIRASVGVDDVAELNRSYRDFARFHGFQIDPTPAYSPEKNGKVEATVKYVKNNFFASLRDKVHSLRVWWITIIVEDANGGPPTVGDTSSWAQAHQDAYIPVLADETQQIRDTYNAGQYPFVFLVDPAMALYFWEVPQQGGTPQPALWAVQQYL